MEDPRVIAEIDALIESYNWETLVDDPEDMVSEFKRLVRVSMAKIPFNRPQPTRFFILQILMRILQHPGVQRKERFLKALAYMSGATRTQRGETVGQRAAKQHVSREMIALLQSYTQHRNAIYRFYAVEALTRLAPRRAQVVPYYLAVLRREDSLPNIVRLFDSLKDYLSFAGHPAPGKAEVKADLERYLTTLRRSNQPLMRLAANWMMLNFMRTDPPQKILDQIAADWSALDGYNQTHNTIMYGILDCCRWLDRSAFINLMVALLKNSPSCITALRVAKSVLFAFGHCKTTRRTAFTPAEKQLIEGLIRCDSLWRKPRTMIPKWYRGWRSNYDWGWHERYMQFDATENGLESTRAGLRRQLAHARTIDLPVPRMLHFIKLSDSDLLLSWEPQELYGWWDEGWF